MTKLNCIQVLNIYLTSMGREPVLASYFRVYLRRTIVIIRNGCTSKAYLVIKVYKEKLHRSVALAKPVPYGHRIQHKYFIFQSDLINVECIRLLRNGFIVYRDIYH